MDLQQFFHRTLKRFNIESFSLGYKEDWHPDFEWIVQGNIQGNRYTFSYSPTITVLFEVERSLTAEELSYFRDLFEIISIQKRMFYKENEIEKLQEGLQAIVMNEEVASLLENILQNAVDAIPAATTGILTLFNEETNMLENTATVGLNKEIRQAKFQIGEAIVGKIFAEGKSKLFNNRMEIDQYFHDVSPRNLALLAQEEKFSQTSGLIAVPIKLSDKTVGVILLQQQENQWSFSALDVKTMEHFASQMALAIYNARIYYQLQEREKFLSTRNHIHDTLIHLSLSNRGVSPIIKEMQSFLQGDLLYYDYIYNENVEMNPVKKDDAFFNELLKKVQGDGKADYVEIQEETFFVQPIILDQLMVAVLVARTEREVSDTEKMILEQTAIMISIEMLKKQSLMHQYLTRNQEIYHRITSAPTSEAIQLLNKEINYQYHQRYCVVVVKMEKLKQSSPSEMELHQLMVACKKQLEDYELFICGTDHQMNMFVPYHEKAGYRAIKQEMTALLDQHSTLSLIPLYAGISMSHHDLTHLKNLTDEAQKACDYGARNQMKNVVAYDELGINTLFLTQSKEYMERFVREIFDPLDKEKNDLSNTLRTYVACQASPKKTADLLFIHINTLYQRLDKIEKVLKLSFDDREHYLRIQLACYLYDHYAI